MNEELINLISIILLILGVVGSFLPILPGTLLSIGGLLLYKFGSFNQMPNIYLWIFGLLCGGSVIFNYLLPAKLNQKYGGTKYGSIGSIVGCILGFFFIPIPFGFLIGMFAGVVLGELLHDSKNKKKAISSLKGAVIGFFIGTGFSFFVSLFMLGVVLYYMFRL